MRIYEFLLSKVNRKIANFLIVVWYLSLGLLVFYFLSFSPGEFRYLRF
jgi:hypothetical protein